MGCGGPPLFAPVFLRFAPHRCTGWVLRFQPVGRATRAVPRVLAFRHDAFEPQPASMREHDRPVVLEVFVDQDARQRPGQDRGERRLARDQRFAAQIIAVQFDQIERAQDHAVVVPTLAESIEIGDAVVVAATASPSRTIERAGSRDSASAISGNRRVKSLPGRL